MTEFSVMTRRPRYLRGPPVTYAAAKLMEWIRSGDSKSRQFSQGRLCAKCGHGVHYNECCAPRREDGRKRFPCQRPIHYGGLGPRPDDRQSMYKHVEVFSSPATSVCSELRQSQIWAAMVDARLSNPIDEWTPTYEGYIYDSNWDEYCKE